MAQQRQIGETEPLVLPEMRMMVGPVLEKVTIAIRWNPDDSAYVVLTTRDQMARPIDEWMARRAREQRIMEEKIAEQAKELARINQDLKLSNTQLKQFSSIAAHDLQSPLRQVAAFARLLGERPGIRLDATASDYLETMVASLTRMQKMVGSLLHYARLSARNYVFDAVDMAHCVLQARQNLAGLEAEFGAHIEVVTLPAAHGDSVLLIQLWQNLLANALHYRSAAPPVVHVDGVRQGDWVEYSVADNGVGIDAGQATALFEMFRRGDRGQHDGTGIGLSLCMRIVEIHGGKIWFDPARTGGSRVCFTLAALKV